MAGQYHFSGNPNIPFANAINDHFSGNFTDQTGSITGCDGSAYVSPSINSRELEMKGGRGYSIAAEQHIPGNHLPDHQTYNETDVSKHNPSTAFPFTKGGRRYRKLRGGSSLDYYGFSDKNNENLSIFAGSGYPPISKGSQNGGKRRKTIKKIKLHKRRHTNKHSAKYRRTKHSSKKHKSKKHKLGLARRMSSKLFKKIIGGKRKVYKGGYSQFMGDQAFSQGYELGGPITSSTSALANPIPFKPYNNCADTFGSK